MHILGIETSCDETAASVVSNGRWILSNTVSSSLNEHKRFGGIIPEIASRRQIELINYVVKKALTGANLKLNDIDAIAVTMTPGLIGSLLVGASFARALSYAMRKPLIEVDHIKAHLYANFIAYRKNAKNKKMKSQKQIPNLPAIGLVVSGGHTSLFHMTDYHRYRLLGQTRDDAAGEAFDKVARLLGLGYPGGPIIDRLAKTGANDEICFSCANMPGTFDFSFSGIKTAVFYHIRDHYHKKKIPLNKISYAFQKAVVSVLVNKCISICKQKRATSLVVGGGVAANSSLREHLLKESKKQSIKVHFPILPLCTDNAAMVAGLGYHYIKSRTGLLKKNKKRFHLT